MTPRPVRSLFAACLITACATPPTEGEGGRGGEGGSGGAGGGTGSIPGAGEHGYTHQRADGNRLVSGKGTFPDVDTTDIPLAGAPRWVVAARVEQGAAWVVVLASGDVQAFLVDGASVTPAAVEPTELSPSLPPVLRADAAGLHLLVPPGPADTASPPAPIDDSHLAFRDQNGDLVLWDGAEVGRLPVQLLPDARLCTDGAGHVAALASPTDRYDHGILGDGLDAGSLLLLGTDPFGVLAEAFVPEPAVIEGIFPLWADVDGDGAREVVVPVSDAATGTRLVLHGEDGAVLAEGPAIGTGYRWRHPIAVAPFGPGGEVEIAAVRTPHIGGIAEFYRWTGSSLSIVAQLPGVTSHVIGSRNLDMALAGDLDGDGAVELVVPLQSREALVGVRRVEPDGASIGWTLGLDGVAATNLAAVSLPETGLVLGVGREDGVLRLFRSRP